MYEGTVLKRGAKAEGNLDPVLKRIIDDNGLEADAASFTLMALRLRPNHELQMKDTVGDIPRIVRHLAHTYHYYLLHKGAPHAAASGASSASSASGARPLPVSITVTARGHASAFANGQMQV